MIENGSVSVISPTSSCPELRRFAQLIRRVESAVLAAVTRRLWSNRPVEGHSNRMTTVKRKMNGREGFVLLRARAVNARSEGTSSTDYG